MAETTAKSKKMSKNQMYLLGAVVLIILLVGVNFYYMKKVKTSKADLALANANATKNEPLLDNAGMGGDLEATPDRTTDISGDMG